MPLLLKSNDGLTALYADDDPSNEGFTASIIHDQKRKTLTGGHASQNHRWTLRFHEESSPVAIGSETPNSVETLVATLVVSGTAHSRSRKLTLLKSICETVDAAVAVDSEGKFLDGFELPPSFVPSVHTPTV